ncbi:MAG: tetratricopeptide repeat-containing glycosyltransferase family protein [Cyanobacteria bacterium P01_D01_bin.73]
MTPDPAVAPWLSQAAHLLQKNRSSEAIAILQHSILQDPNQPWLWYGLATIYSRQHRWDTAIACIGKLLKLDANALETFNQPTGLALNSEDDSLPNLYAVCLYNQGVALDKANETEAAIALYRQALDIAPSFPQAGANLFHGLLRIGELQEGFARQEMRWDDPNKRAIYQNCFEKPTWDGSPIPGKTLLLFAEQGFGDAIQFSRFVAIAAERCQQIILQAPPPLLSLMATLTGVPDYRPPAGQEGHFDYQASFMSLPHILGIDAIDQIPSNVPYLLPPATPTLPPPQKPVPDGHHELLKIAICWSCNVDSPSAQHRSTDLANFAAIAHLPQVQCYSVQKELTDEDRQHLQRLNIIDLSDRLDNFATTAAYLNQCDLVISVDTAIAHLAGAIARPVWMAIAFHSDWRWFRDRTDSPWYPTARLFRQSKTDDWHSAFEAMQEAMKTTFGDRHFTK